MVAGIFALQFFSEVPKVRKDIMQVCSLDGSRTWKMDAHRIQKLPVIGDYFERETPPSDNVSVKHRKTTNNAERFISHFRRSEEYWNFNASFLQL